MPHLTLTGRALRDLERCHDFLVSKNPQAASRAVQTIRDGLQVLVAHPRAGRIVVRADGALREWPIRFGVSGYMVLYRHDDDEVTVLAIRHQRESGFR